ncbi:2548_t:CDS:2, partial [Entrophospora sp. SA101]
MTIIPAPPPARYTYLISRRGDFLISIFSGALSYYIYEIEERKKNNDRKSLKQLIMNR